ncbi:MAG: LL-diaminopimelate aminotransferase [Candidatus Caenarcaniphilales bacterium]|nr:LL-diaminopimelate aminotransferase [Candidatus Caenarcaniphilales bacterium]
MTSTKIKNKYAAKRLDNIPPYLFAEIDKKKQAAIERGVDIINLGIGDPDQPTPKHIVDAMHKAIDDPSTHNYPPYEGTKEFRKACVQWHSKRFGLPEFNPNTECVSSIGMKEAIHNMILATVDEDDYSLIPSPAYPVYKTSTIMCGGVPHIMPLREDNSFLVDFDLIPEEVAKKAKIMFLNYPNNPTGAFASKEFYEKVITFAKRHDILVCQDAAYSENYFDEANKPISIFEVKGAKDVAVEFFSLSKGYNMTGWRVGFTVGNPDAIQALGTVKTNIDSGVFKAIQNTAIKALTDDQSHMDPQRKLYKERAAVAEEGLKSLGWQIKRPCQGTLYIWQPIPPKYKSSIDFAADMLDKAGIVVPPGIGYGDYGEGYFRIALSAEKSRIEEAIVRMKQNGLVFEE